MLIKRTFIFCMLMAINILSTIPCCAAAEDIQLPVIASCQNGHGYREDGTQILDGWAYDSANPAGKYVLFDADGGVVCKAESQEKADIAKDYTATELHPAVIALRAEVFEGFAGKIAVVLEEKSGIQKYAELNTGNFFGLNVQVNSGDYTFRQVEATDGANIYMAEFSDVALHLPEQGMRVMKIRVTEEKVEQMETDEKASEAEMEEAQNKQDKEQREKKRGKEGDGMQEMSTKRTIALFGWIGAACLAGILLLRKKRKKYD